MRPYSLIRKSGAVTTIALLFLSSHLLASQPADDPCISSTVCTALSEQGRVASNQSRYQDALTAFQGAYENTPAPWLLINIGRAQYRLGMAEQAITSFQKYQKLVPNPPAEEAQRLRTFIAEAQVQQLVRAAQRTQDAKQLAEAPTKELQSAQEKQPQTSVKLLLTAGSTTLGLGITLLGIGAAGFAVQGPCGNTLSMGQAACLGIYGGDTLGTTLGPVIGGTALSTLGVGLLIYAGRSWSLARPIHPASGLSEPTRSPIGP
jgi:tetratricopeptide (TPR) repeat protein